MDMPKVFSFILIIGFVIACWDLFGAAASQKHENPLRGHISVREDSDYKKWLESLKKCCMAMGSGYVKNTKIRALAASEEIRAIIENIKTKFGDDGLQQIKEDWESHAQLSGLTKDDLVQQAIDEAIDNSIDELNEVIGARIGGAAQALAFGDEVIRELKKLGIVDFLRTDIDITPLIGCNGKTIQRHLSTGEFKDVEVSDCVVGKLIFGGEKNCFNELVKRYKIHFMPKDADFIPFVKELCVFIKSNKEIKSLIRSIKIKPILETSSGMREVAIVQVPKVVVYAEGGKEEAQQVLNILFQKFGTREGLNRAPAFNQKVTSFIYFAQGNREEKLIEKNASYFEQPDMVYYRADITSENRDYHLVHPGTGKRL